MAKKVNTKSKKSSSVNKKKTAVKKPNVSKKTPTKSKKKANVINDNIRVRKINKKVVLFIIFICAVLLIFATYAWFSTNLNIKIKTFNLVVSQNSDLTISFDGVNFARSIELTKEEVYKNLGELYPDNTTQWPSNGLIPVSSPGLMDPNSPIFTMFHTSGVLYHVRDKERGFLNTYVSNDNKPREFNSYLAFDLFIKNDTGSPESDNLYLDKSVYINATEDADEEMLGLINSFRIGMVKIGSVNLKASVDEIQGIQCNNNCKSVIYEPNSHAHTDLSIERAKKYGVDLKDGEAFPTYAYIKEGGPLYVENSVSGSPKMDLTYFKLQETMIEEQLEEPLFDIPNGITKMRVYVWIEGQDIDSLETDSNGTDVDISISFVKDTAGWDMYDE